MREARSSGPFRQVAPSAWGHSDPWEFLIGLEGRASNRGKPRRRAAMAPRPDTRQGETAMAIARKASDRANSAGPAEDSGRFRLFTEPLAPQPHYVAPRAWAAMLADRLSMFLLGAIMFQLVEIIRTWP